MANRYQSIANDVAGSFLADLANAPIHEGQWTIVDGRLAIRDAKGKVFFFEYEKGDQLSDILVEFLNLLPYLAAAAKGHKNG